MNYDDLETFTMHGLAFRCSHAQFVRLRSRFVRLPAYLRWHRLDTLVRMHHVCSDTILVFEEQTRIAHQLAEQLAEADRDATLGLVELLHEEELTQ